MGARAIWKGVLHVGAHAVPVKMYSAVEDRAVHFKLVAKSGHHPVHQQIVRKDTREEVAAADRRKAFPLDNGDAVILQPDELEALEPPASRDIHLCRFVPRGMLGDQWFDRPYVLGPDGDDDRYFALARAIAVQQVQGIARWTMRKKRYLGALDVAGDHLAMMTLRRAEQILALPAIEPGRAATPSDAEMKLAQQLVDTISGDFDPTAWRNEHRERLQALIAAKASGGKVTPLRPPRREQAGDLADALRASIAAGGEKRVA